MAKKILIYEYAKCSTCKNALKFLEKRKIGFEKKAIVETPPTEKELRQMLKWMGGELKKLFNTSGIQYRVLGLSEKLSKMSLDQALSLLSQNGKLVKRPFVLGENFGLLGFKQKEWEEKF
jgi:arsenate reductase